MKYVAIDVETTGLDREHDQILEFAAVFTSLEDVTPLEELEIFHTYVIHPRISGDVFALNMNQVAIERLAKRPKEFNYTRIEDLAATFHKFVLDTGGPVETNDLVEFKGSFGFTSFAKLVIAGKNYAAFDAHFVNRIPHWEKLFKPHHRSIDPAALFLRATDTAPPDLQTCLQRAGIEGVVKHEAASDAYDVIKLLRAYGLATADKQSGT